MHTPRYRPRPEQDFTTELLKLARGQSIQVWLPAGSRIVCNAPAARVTEAPYWQAEQLRQRRTELSDGQSMHLEHAGWAEIAAVHGGELLCLRPATHRYWSRAWNALLRLLPRGLGARIAPR